MWLSYLLTEQDHLCLCVLKTHTQFPCFEAEFMGETALIDLALEERHSYLELCFDTLTRLTGRL